MQNIWLVFHFKSNAKHAQRVKQLLLEQLSSLARAGFPGARVFTTYGAYDALLLLAAESQRLFDCRNAVNRLASDLAHRPDIWLKEVGEWVLWSADAEASPLPGEVRDNLALTFIKLRPCMETSCATPTLRRHLLNFVRDAVRPGDLAPGVWVRRFNHFGWADVILGLSDSDATRVAQLAMAIRGHWAVASSGSYLAMDCAANNDFPAGCEGDVRCAFNNGTDFARFIQSHVGSQARTAEVAPPRYRVALGRFDLATGVEDSRRVRQALAELGRDVEWIPAIESSTTVCVSQEAEQKVAMRLAALPCPMEIKPLPPNPAQDWRDRVRETREHLATAVEQAVQFRIFDRVLAGEALAVAELIDVSCGSPQVHDHFIDLVGSFWRFVAALELQLRQLQCPLPEPPLLADYGFKSGMSYTRDTPDWCDARATLYTEVSWALQHYYRSALHRHRGGLDSLFYPQLGQTIARSSLHRLLAVCDEIVFHTFPRADFWQANGYDWGGHICLSERAGVAAFRLLTYDIIGIPYRGSIALLSDLGVMTTVLIHEAAHMVYQGMCEVMYKLPKNIAAWPPEVRSYKDDLRILAVHFANYLSATSSLAPPPIDEVEKVRPDIERAPALTPEIWSDLHLLRIIAPRDEWVATFLSLARDEFVLFDRAEHPEIVYRLVATILAQHRTDLERDVLRGRLEPVKVEFSDGPQTTRHARTWPKELDDEVLQWFRDRLPVQGDFPELSNLLGYARQWLNVDVSRSRNPGRELAGIFAVVRSTIEALDVLVVTELSRNWDLMLTQAVPESEDSELRYRRFRALLRGLWLARGPNAKSAPPSSIVFDKMCDLVSHERWQLLLSCAKPMSYET